MKSIHIRDLSDETLSALKRRAARHHRSLQKEIKALLEDAASMQIPEDDSPHLRLRVTESGHSGGWNREEIYGDDGR